MNFSGQEISKIEYISPVQSTLFVILLLAAIVGHGLFFFLYIRHKTLRTVHHALFAELSIIDSLNSIINIPLSICYVVYDIPVFRGRTFAWTVSFLHIFFALLSLASMALQMVDRYLAVCWPIFYKTKKSMTKIIAAIFVKWLVILTIVLVVYVPLYDADLGNSPVLEYRELYAKQSGQKLPRYVVPVLVLMILLFGGLTLWNLRKRQVEVTGAGQNAHNSPSMRARKKAVYTILILLTITLISYLPAAIKARLWLGHENQKKAWLVFVIIFTLFVPSAVNPFIVLFRVKCFSDKLETLTNNVKSMCCKNQADVETCGGPNLVKYDAAEAVERRNFGDNRFMLRATSCSDIVFTRKTEKERRESV